MDSTSLALTLGNTAVRQLDGLFSLNDLHAAAGGEDRHQPYRFIRLDGTQALIAEIQSPEVATAASVINGGPERGTYACRELVIAYAAWISPAFHLKVIRVFLATQAPPAEDERDRLIADLRRLLAERTLQEQPKLKRVLHYYNNPTLTHMERTRLMGWKSSQPWYESLRLLSTLGLIDYRPNTTLAARAASGRQKLLALRTAKAQGAAQ